MAAQLPESRETFTKSGKPLPLLGPAARSTPVTRTGPREGENLLSASVNLAGLPFFAAPTPIHTGSERKTSDGQRVHPDCPSSSAIKKTALVPESPPFDRGVFLPGTSRTRRGRVRTRTPPRIRYASKTRWENHVGAFVAALSSAPPGTTQTVSSLPCNESASSRSLLLAPLLSDVRRLNHLSDILRHRLPAGSRSPYPINDDRFSTRHVGKHSSSADMGVVSNLPA